MQEEFDPNKQTEKDTEKAISEVEDQMRDFTLEKPTPENISYILQEIKSQFEDELKGIEGASGKEIDDAIAKHLGEGWILANVASNNVDESLEEGIETKVVGLGNKFLVFKRKRAENIEK